MPRRIRGFRPDRRGKIEALKLVSSKRSWWMPKSPKILRRRPQSGDRKSFGKTCRVIWGCCRARAEALRGLGFRNHLFAEKVRKTKASIKQKCMIMTFFFERSVWSRKSIENCNVWWFSLWCDVPERGSLFRSPSLFAQFCNSLTASKTAHVWSKTVFLQECLVLPHHTEGWSRERARPP